MYNVQATDDLRASHALKGWKSSAENADVNSCGRSIHRFLYDRIWSTRPISMNIHKKENIKTTYFIGWLSLEMLYLRQIIHILKQKEHHPHVAYPNALLLPVRPPHHRDPTIPPQM